MRQLQAAAAGLDACAGCDGNCCSWASAQVKWHLSGDDADALDETEASFRAALQARRLCACFRSGPTSCVDLVRCARQADGGNGAAFAAYAVFTHEERGNQELASALFDAAAVLSPNDSDVLASWAYFAMKTGM